jgi:hypothetical protein
MHRQWIAMEHYRLHSIEHWPDSPYKKAVLEAIHSTLATLRANSPVSLEKPQCVICASRVREFARGLHDTRGLAQFMA